MDDIESCFWILLYIALHHFESNATWEQASAVFDFHNSSTLDGISKSKVSFLRRTSAKLTFKTSALNTLYHNFSRFISLYDNRATLGEQGIALEMERGNSVLEILDQGLEMTDWPEDDAIEDPFPPKSKSELRRKARLAHESATRTATGIISATSPTDSNTGAQQPSSSRNAGKRGRARQDSTSTNQANIAPGKKSKTSKNTSTSTAVRSSGRKAAKNMSQT